MENKTPPEKITISSGEPRPYSLTDREIAIVLASLNLTVCEIAKYAAEAQEIHRKLTLQSERE